MSSTRDAGAVGGPAAIPIPHGLLLLDKPVGPTSHDMVAMARRALRCRAVGHAGTLDPMASGLLLLLAGYATRLVPFLTQRPKQYQATVELGVETDTLDAEGSVVRRMPPPRVSITDVRRVCAGMLGSIEQVPPAFSAIKQGGEPLHRRARRGDSVAPDPRRVELRALEVLELETARIRLHVECSKGFYVRALARDLAHKLGSVGSLVALRRTHVEPFEVEAALESSLLQRAQAGDGEARAAVHRALIPPANACPWLPSLHLSSVGVEHARHGRPVPFDQILAGEPPPDAGVALLTDRHGRLLAVARHESGLMRVLRGFPP